MEESNRSSLSRMLQAVIPIAGVSVAVISLLLAVASRRKEMTCSLVASTRLVGENLSGINPNLHVEFNSQPVVTLSKLTFTLRNTGAAAIRGADIVEPIHLQFPVATRILSATVERMSPQRFAFAVTAAPGGNDVVLTFSLLNSGDEAQFSTYILNSEIQRPLFLGRVVDVPQLIYSDSIVTSTTPNGGILPHVRSRAIRSITRRLLSVSAWLVAAIALGFWIAAVVGYIRYLFWKREFGPVYSEIREQAFARQRDELKPRTDDAEGQGDAGGGEFLRLAHGRVLMIPDFDEELEERGIPEHPRPEVESVGGIIGLSILLLSIAYVSALSALIVYQALGT